MLTVLSIVLMVVDARFDALKPLRAQLGLLVAPLYTAAEMPVRAWQSVTELATSRAQLIAENERLRAEALLTQRKLQKLATLTEQNVRLRELLNSSSLVDERVLVAELIGVDPNPFTQRILLDKGEVDGVFLGQPVLDATGLMGQVVEVLPHSARVLLITDASHSLPVQINRNGLRAIARVNLFSKTIVKRAIKRDQNGVQTHPINNHTGLIWRGYPKPLILILYILFTPLPL